MVTPPGTTYEEMRQWPEEEEKPENFDIGGEEIASKVTVNHVYVTQLIEKSLQIRNDGKIGTTQTGEFILSKTNTFDEIYNFLQEKGLL